MTGQNEFPSGKLQKAFPEMGAGGYTRMDGTVDFYSRINALIRPNNTILDFGAGRGAQLLGDRAEYRTSLACLHGKVARLVGVDVDPAIEDNPYLDEAHVIDPREPLPFEAGTFDIIFSDWVLEHVEHPAPFASEALRVLKPGGWFCARTPNRWGVTGIGANLVPNSMHTRFLERLQPERNARDAFPTTYKLNTRRRLRHYFPPTRWEDFSYIHNPDPPYVQRSKTMIEVLKVYFRLAPNFLGTNMHIFLRKVVENPEHVVSSSGKSKIA